MPSARPSTIDVAVAGPIARGDVPAICGYVATLLERSGAQIARCDVRALTADATTVDALARIQLAAKRMGRQVVLRHARDDLRELLAFIGLSDVLWIEPLGQAEEREDRLGLEEEGEFDDPTA